jgi:hypothetical protein
MVTNLRVVRSACATVRWGYFDERSNVGMWSDGQRGNNACGSAAEGANVMIADILEQEGRMPADELTSRAARTRRTRVGLLVGQGASPPPKVSTSETVSYAYKLAPGTYIYPVLLTPII